MPVSTMTLKGLPSVALSCRKQGLVGTPFLDSCRRTPHPDPLHSLHLQRTTVTAAPHHHVSRLRCASSSESPALPSQTFGVLSLRLGCALGSPSPPSLRTSCQDFRPPLVPACNTFSSSRDPGSSPGPVFGPSASLPRSPRMHHPGFCLLSASCPTRLHHSLARASRGTALSLCTPSSWPRSWPSRVLSATSPFAASPSSSAPSIPSSSTTSVPPSAYSTSAVAAASGAVAAQRSEAEVAVLLQQQLRAEESVAWKSGSVSNSTPQERDLEQRGRVAAAAAAAAAAAPESAQHARRFGNSMESTPMVQEAWELLQASTVYYCNQPVGTVAASDPTDNSPLNYDQVFIRDFIPSAVALMLAGQPEIVRNFLLCTLQLQSWEKTVDCHRPGEGLMPASFKVTQVPMEGGAYGAYEEHLDPDFGESAIGRVAPVDSGLWWIQLLRAYGRYTGDLTLQHRVDVQTGMKLILKVCLADHFDMFPTLITTDGSCMIDRRLGIHGHPLEIQSLLYGALRAAKEMLSPEDGGADLIRAVDARLTALSFHIRHYYWLDLKKLNEIYRYKTEEYSYEAVNKFNIYPEQIPSWLMEWIPDRGGYFVGNVQPAHMDFRFFNLGNMWAIVSALASPQQAEAVLDLVEDRWVDLVGHMPMKITFPALEGEEWRIITGADPKNTPWSYHNGGSWPVLLWQFTAACIKMGRPHLAERAIQLAEKRLHSDRWPEYYDTRGGRFIGKQARLHQTWTLAGYLASKQLLANPEAVWLFAVEEDHDIVQAGSTFLCEQRNPRRRRRGGAVPSRI